MRVITRGGPSTREQKQKRCCMIFSGTNKQKRRDENTTRNKNKTFDFRFSQCWLGINRTLKQEYAVGYARVAVE